MERYQPRTGGFTLQRPVEVPAILDVKIGGICNLLVYPVIIVQVFEEGIIEVKIVVRREIDAGEIVVHKLHVIHLRYVFSCECILVKAIALLHAVKGGLWLKVSGRQAELAHAAANVQYFFARFVCKKRCCLFGYGEGRPMALGQLADLLRIQPVKSRIIGKISPFYQCFLHALVFLGTHQFLVFIRTEQRSIVEKLGRADEEQPASVLRTFKHQVQVAVELLVLP